MLTPHQEAKRRSGVGASEVAAVLGLSAYQTPLDVYLRKVRGEVLGTTPAMHWGTMLEKAIGQHYAEANQVKLRRGRTVRSKKNPIMLCTPDYIRLDDGRPVQIKTARVAEGWGPTGTTEVPLGYACQVAWEMAVLERPAAVLAVLIGGSDYRQYDLQRDLETEALMAERVSKFWQDHVEKMVPPPARDPEEAKAYLQTLWRKTQGRLLDATPEVIDLSRKLAGARDASNAAEKTEIEIENQIKQLIGDADGIQLPDGKIVWKHNPERTVVDWKQLSIYDLKASAEQIQKRTIIQPGSRVFRVSGPLFKTE